jgi:hypothetical protein
VGAKNPVTLCHLGILADQAAKAVAAENPDISTQGRWMRTPGRRALLQCSVRAMKVVTAPRKAHLDSDWPSAAADAFSAVGAFLVGFVLLRREHRREADQAEDERRAQAARVSAWVEIIRKVDGSRELAFHIHNASGMPIYEVELPLLARHGEQQGAEFVGGERIPTDLRRWIIIGCPRPMWLIVACDGTASADRRRG